MVHCSEKKGYKMGMTVSSNGPDSGIGGDCVSSPTSCTGWCCTARSRLWNTTIIGGIDLFPDFNRQISFGTGTSIVYNYLDYRVHNPTQSTFQFRISLTEEHLRGELRAAEPLSVKFHVKESESYFQEVGDVVYRRNLVHRSIREKRTGNEIANDLIVESNAKVLYDRELINAPIRLDQSVAAGH
ncbi:hypothetical protein NHF46_15705 [Arthrobacter alpinus]|nr:hypothetical protein [Arthrobacter alpinus]